MILTRGLGGASNTLLSYGMGNYSNRSFVFPKPKLTMQIHLTGNEIILSANKSITMNLEPKAISIEQRSMELVPEETEIAI